MTDQGNWWTDDNWWTEDDEDLSVYCPKCGYLNQAHEDNRCPTKAEAEAFVLGGVLVEDETPTRPQQEAEMKPCPFCASKDIRYSANRPDGHLFWCGNCGALGPNDVSFEHAVKMWNLRRPEAALLDALENTLELAKQLPALQPGGWEGEIIEEGYAALAAVRPQEEATR